MSQCLACKGTRFEVVVVEPTGSNYKMIFVQCGTCGGVVGVTDYMNSHSMIVDQTKELKRELASIERSIAIVNDNLGRIAQRLSR